MLKSIKIVYCLALVGEGVMCILRVLSLWLEVALFPIR